MAGISVKINEQPTSVYTVILAGPLDSGSHELFIYSLEEILRSTTKAIVLDMKGVDYVSSMGINAIFNVRKAAQANGFELRMVHLQPQVKKVLDAVKAMPSEAVFKNEKELEEYLRKFK